MPIPDAVCQKVINRSGNQCEGLYEKFLGKAKYIGPCPCHGRFPLVFAYIRHTKTYEPRDRVENVLHLCCYSHDLYDLKITRRQFNKLMKEGEAGEKARAKYHEVH